MGEIFDEKKNVRHERKNLCHKVARDEDYISKKQGNEDFVRAHK